MDLDFYAGITDYELMRRLVTKADRHESGCWIWRGYVGGEGYGQMARYFSNRRVRAAAHRVAHTLFIGPIPEGLVVDHLCSNRLCVNPDHLQAVTRELNSLRGFSPSTISALRTNFCQSGRHELIGGNVKWNTDGYRSCRTCRNEKRRAATAARVKPPGRGNRYRHDIDNSEVLALRAAGVTYEAIGKRFGLTKNGARERYLLAQRLTDKAAA